MGILSTQRGSILLEGVFAQALLSLSLLLACEVARRGVLEIVLQHGAFLAARATMVGDPRAARRAEVERFVSEALGESWGRTVARSLSESAVGSSRLHVRYPALLRLPIGRGTKHHFEITKTCHFPST